MAEFLQALIKLKIPNLVLIAIIFGFGVDLIKGADWMSAQFAWGCALIFIAVFFSMLFFVDYQNKERMDRLVGYYEKALETISSTHSTIEDNTRNKFSPNTDTGSSANPVETSTE